MLHPIKVLITTFLSVAFLVTIAWAGSGNIVVESANKTAKFKVVKDKDGAVQFQEKDFIKSKPKYFIYRLPETSIRFVVLRSSDGVVRAAFDACEVCYQAKKGFHQEGDFMVCNNCGNKYPSNSINEETGSCNPVPLIRTVQAEKLIIKVEDLKKGIKYF